MKYTDLYFLYIMLRFMPFSNAFYEFCLSFMFLSYIFIIYQKQSCEIPIFDLTLLEYIGTTPA